MRNADSSIAADNMVNKARRLTLTGKVRLIDVTREPGGDPPGKLVTVKALIVGDSGDRTVTFEAGGTGWRCDCPSHSICSHIIAVSEFATGQQ